MRALTIRQPHAWAVVYGGKDVENRSRNIAGAYRGPVAIHAGLTDASDAAYGLTEEWQHWWSTAYEPGQQRGAIIGVVDLVDVHAATPDDLGRIRCQPANRESGTWRLECSPWAMETNYHLVLANPRALATPIPYKGRLGLWTLPDVIADQVTAATALPCDTTHLTMPYGCDPTLTLPNDQTIEATRP